MKKEKTILLTYYIKNTDEQTKNAFNIVPYKSTELTISEDRLVQLIEADMKNMGMLMKSVMAELKDKADGSAVNKAVKEFLSGK